MKDDERALLVAVANRMDVKASRKMEDYRGLLVRDRNGNILRSHPFFDLIGEDIDVPEESAREIGARLGIHPKRVEYLCQKWTDRGWYDYGVNVDLGWLTDQGKAKAAEFAS